MLLDGENAEAMQHPDVVQRLIAPWIPEGHARVERSAVYTFHGLIAHEWRRGRVVLAGDAAHQMPPFLGQGMCSGLRDAANLAWKIDAVVRGASPDLLDTFQAEREPHVRAIVEAAVGFGRIICTTDIAEATSRDEMMLAARAAASEAPAGPGGIPLPPLSGPLVGHGGGRPSAQPTLDGTRLDDLVGPRWLVVTNEAADRHTMQAFWGDLAVVLSCEEHPALSSVLGEDDDGTPFAVAVVRPDRYVSLRSMHPSDVSIPPMVSGSVTR
jgi:3-(3-hydroxy-phenyl)propionate hydroxylase